MFGTDPLRSRLSPENRIALAFEAAAARSLFAQSGPPEALPGRGHAGESPQEHFFIACGWRNRSFRSRLNPAIASGGWDSAGEDTHQFGTALSPSFRKLGVLRYRRSDIGEQPRNGLKVAGGAGR